MPAFYATPSDSMPSAGWAYLDPMLPPGKQGDCGVWLLEVRAGLTLEVTAYRPGEYTWRLLFNKGTEIFVEAVDIVSARSVAIGLDACVFAAAASFSAMAVHWACERTGLAFETRGGLVQRRALPGSAADDGIPDPDSDIPF